MSKAPCIPSHLPPRGIDWLGLARLLGEASRELGRYDGLLDGMGNEEILLAPIITNEAVLSSRIEGTQASLGEVFRHEACEKFDEHKRGDIFEVLNYRHALRLGERSVRQGAVSLVLIRQLHKELLNGVRGKDENPGDFRANQNWIGKPGCTIDEARFIPPSPLIMRDGLEQWETFAKQDFDDPLIQAGLLHTQFEIIHPFNDGNGRIGRMFIPLFLYQKNVLKRPTFYLSEYLEAHRDLYYDRLLAITEDGDWQGWLQFFLTALVHQARVNADKARKIITLYDELKKAFPVTTRSQFAISALDSFFAHPIMTGPMFYEATAIRSRGTAASILRQLVAAGHIEIASRGAGRRPAIYAITRLIEIAEGWDG